MSKYKVGDVVKVKLSDTEFNGVFLGEDANYWWFFSGDSVPQRISKNEDVNIERTGRHIDIQSILEQIGGKE